MVEKKTVTLLGRMLVDAGVITEDELVAAVEEHKKTGDFLGTSIIKLGFATEEDILPVLSKQLNIDYIKIKEIAVNTEVKKKVPAKFAYHYKLMPIQHENDLLTIVVTDPLNVTVLDDISLLLGYKIKAAIGGEKDIVESIRQYYGVGAETIEKMMDTADGVEATTKSKTEDIEQLANDATVGKLVNQILLEAFRDRATDIHIEPHDNQLKIRYRIDGILYDAKVPPAIKQFQSAIISRIKIMSSLNISERRLPQDGRIKVRVGDNDLDLRVSVIPTAYGESVVIRLLTPTMLYSLSDLGLCKEDLKIMDALIKKPHGIIFVTGPTGSGKTTSLYACLSKINTAEKKIITIEDPIEYQLLGITQIQIHPRIGLTFAQGLRSMLRHDPDIMMVGEVRDFETAEITIRVALTGHLVFSTLHTNDAASAIARLLDMGVESYLISSSVDCFVAQRLVRLICPSCKTEVKPQEQMIKNLGIENVDISNLVLYEGKGCEACKFTGFRGRTGVYEFLVMNEEIRSMVLERVPANQIKQKAIETGMRTLLQDGWEKVRQGRTTVSEVIRVAQQEELLID